MLLFSSSKTVLMNDFLDGFYDHVNQIELTWGEHYQKLIFI